MCVYVYVRERERDAICITFTIICITTPLHQRKQRWVLGTVFTHNPTYSPPQPNPPYSHSQATSRRAMGKISVEEGDRGAEREMG